MLANYECDLHGHTTRSDGNDTPAEYIQNAAKRGVKILAITDHDITPPLEIETENGKRNIQDYANENGVRLIRGIEISCETYIDDVHLVCFGCDWTNPFFTELEQFIEKSKVENYKKLVEELSKKGMKMTWEEVLYNNGNSIDEKEVQKKMIFELMARKGFFDGWQDAKLFVKNNSDIQIKREKPDAVSIIKKVHELGGIVILAHPYLINETVSYNEKELSRKQFIQILIENGLDGIEACYTYDKTSYGGTLTPSQIKQEVIAEYKKQGLIISGGSDYHADAKKGVKNPREIGECGISVEEFMQYEKLHTIDFGDSPVLFPKSST